MTNYPIKFTEVKSKNEYEIAASLFKEYASQIVIDLEFQNFNKEVENLEDQYSRPEGVIYIIYNLENLPIGCFGIRKLENSICELKRMYLKEDYRGLGFGKKMMEKAIEAGKEMRYQKMRLDTLSTMNTAIGLYKSVGFYEIESYCFNPIETAKYFEINLKE